MSGGVRHALDAAVDRAATSRTVYVVGAFAADVVVTVALFVLGRRLTRP